MLRWPSLMQCEQHWALEEWISLLLIPRVTSFTIMLTCGMSNFAPVLSNIPHNLIGQVTISNDGATILRLLDIVHPAGKALVDISRAQDAEVRGDVSKLHDSSPTMARIMLLHKKIPKLFAHVEFLPI